MTTPSHPLRQTKYMKKISIILAGALMILVSPSFAADALTEALQKGLFEEEANHNLDAAIKAYQDVLSRADEQRRVAATALFRLAECYRKQGKTNEASAEYQRLLRDYADQGTLVNLSRQNLSGLGVSTAAVGSTDAEEQEIRRIKAMIRDSPDLVNARSQGQGGTTVLIDAARQGHLQVVEYLLANGADVEIRDLYNGKPNNTPLHVAAGNGHKRVVELLLAKGASVNAVDQFGRTPLHTAVSRGFRSVIDVLLTHKADVNALSDSGQTPLHMAIAADQLELAKYLIDRGANVNVAVADGTVLHFAVQSLKPRFVELLLQKGADPNARTSSAEPSRRGFGGVPQSGSGQPASGLTPLHLAADGDKNAATRGDIAKLLIDHKAEIDDRVTGQQYGGWTPLHIATSRRLTEFVALLLEKGADPNTPVESANNSESTPLHMAVNRQDHALAELLLKGGARVDELNRDGFSPLYRAASGGATNLVALLLRYNADPNGAGSAFSPLVNPVHNNNLDVAEMLLGKGANPNVTNSFGIPLLHVSLGARPPGSSHAIPRLPVSHGSPPRAIPPRVARTDGSLKAENPEPKRDKTMFELLLEYKADPNIRNLANPERDTILHVATRNDNELAVELLLAAGAEVNARNDYGATPLHWAKGQRVIDMLLSSKANPNAADDQGETPLHRVVATGDTNVISALLTKGAEINACTAAGDTPLRKLIRTANIKEQFAAVEFLLKTGADILKKCGRELSPFEEALARHPKLAELLRKYYPQKLAIVNLEGLFRQQVWFWQADKQATLSQAVAAVGLFENADPTRISILRDDPNTGLKKRFVHDLEAIREKRVADVPLQDGDKIIVPSRDGAVQ